MNRYETSLHLPFVDICFSKSFWPTNYSSLRDPIRLPEKSKHQKTAAWILLGGGAALVTAGALIPEGDERPDTFYGGLPTTSNENDGIKGALGLTGVLSMIGSIPLFIASGKNKKRALSASTSLKIEKAPTIQRASIVKRSYPALSIRIGL